MSYMNTETDEAARRQAGVGHGDAVGASARPGSPDRRRMGVERRGGGDRRQEGRLPFVAAVLQRPVEHRGAAPFTSGSRLPLLGQAANLGRCGMLLRRCRGEDEAPLPQDTQLSVSFELPDGGALMTLAATVVFERPQDSRHFATGLRFCDPPPEARLRLDRYLALCA